MLQVDRSKSKTHRFLCQTAEGNPGKPGPSTEAFGTLAKELGIVTTTYSNWEQGRTLPALTYLPALARFFGVTTDYLLGVSKEDTIDEVTKLMKQLPKSSQAAIECLIAEMLKKK